MCWIEIERISFLLGPWPYWRSMNIFIVFRAIAFLLHWSSSLALDRRHMWLQVKFGAFQFFYMCLIKDWTQMLTNFHISTKVCQMSSYVSFLWRATGLGLVSSIGTLG